MAREYERLKVELAIRYRDDRRTYTDSKAAFIAGVIDMAMRDARVTLGYSQRWPRAPFDTDTSTQLGFESTDKAQPMSRHVGNRRSGDLFVLCVH